MRKNNRLIFGDLHLQNWSKESVIFHKEAILDKLRFGLLIFDNDISAVDLIITGDLISAYGENYEKGFPQGMFDIFAFIFSTVNEFLAERGLFVNRVLYIYGNHDFDFDIKTFSNHRGKGRSFMLLKDGYEGFPIRDAFEELIEYVYPDAEIVDISSTGLLDRTSLFVGNVLRSPLLTHEEMISGCFSNEYGSTIYNGIYSMHKFLMLVVEDSMFGLDREKEEEIDALVGLTDEIDALVGLFKSYTKKLRASVIISDKVVYGSVFMYLYHVILIVQQVLLYKKLMPNLDIKELNMVLHFPFDFGATKDVGRWSNIVQKELSLNKKYPVNLLTRFFVVDIKQLEFILDILLPLFSKLESLNVYSGHTHSSEHVFAKYDKNIEFQMITNSLGTPGDYFL